MDQAGADWRTGLQPDSRHRIVNKILDTLKKHTPPSTPQRLVELTTIAVKYEERMFSSATSQSDYLRKISLKMLSVETRSQNSGVANVLPQCPVISSGNPSDPGTQSRIFTWTIDNFSAINSEIHYSGDFALDGYQWHLLIFPKGKSLDQISIYLAVSDSYNLPDGWTRYAQFGLSVVNQFDRHYNVRRDTHHIFKAQERDWGFSSFMSLGDLYESGKGFLVNDRLIIQADLFVPIDLTRETVYVGNLKLAVHFRALEKPEEDVFCLELSNHSTYDEIVQRVARHVGVHDPLKIRLTLHNWVSQEPAPSPIEYRGMDRLQDMLINSNQALHILYYEVFGISKAWAGDDTNEQSAPSSCAICWNSPKEGACVPCGHMVACMSCLKKVQDKMLGCPVCRADIQQVIRIFLV